jgi:hypothetical protein
MSAVRDCLFSIFTATLHIWRPFFQLQLEDAPCHGDGDVLITAEMEESTKFCTEDVYIALTFPLYSFTCMRSSVYLLAYVC